MKQIYLIPVCLLLAAGCSDSLAPGSQGAPRNMSMTFGSSSSSSTAPSARIVGSQPGAFADVSASDQTNALVITKAQLVLSELELKKIETAVCDDEHADGSSSDDSASVDHDGCEKIETGPLLVDLPLNGSVGSSVNFTVPADTYRKLEMRVRTVDATDDGGAAFLAANPSFAGVSIRVEGTFNGQPFVFTSDVNVDLEIEFASPIVVDHDGLNVTVNVDVSSWFRTDAGLIIDPLTALAGGSNESLVTGNIQASFHAFHDDNRDGHDDDGPDHH
ncbi:MAG TPA: hypothetical protein VFJ96_08550 [Gemmatimonadaceae bacterium]|nr:hypothetical protein [Gemmatimonadaceae bacterium]